MSFEAPIEHSKKTEEFKFQENIYHFQSQKYFNCLLKDDTFEKHTFWKNRDHKRYKSYNKQLWKSSVWTQKQTSNWSIYTVTVACTKNPVNMQYTGHISAISAKYKRHDLLWVNQYQNFTDASMSY